MKTKIKKIKGGKLAITLTCENCGEHIDQVSKEFGMDCKNHCREKEFKKQLKGDPILKFIGDWLSPDNKFTTENFDDFLKQAVKLGLTSKQPPKKKKK